MKIKVFLFIFLLFSIIAHVLASECTEKKINIESEATDNTQEPTEGNTQEATGGNTQEATGGNTQEATGGNTQEATGGNTQEANNVNSSGRRMLNILTNEDCKKLKTQDDDKYQCVVKSNNLECIEVEKESSFGLKFSLSIILFLSFLYLSII